MEYAYYSRAAVTASGECSLIYYPQPIVDDTAATIKQLKRQFFNQIQTPRSITLQSTSPALHKQNASGSNLKRPLSEERLAIGMIVFVQPKSEDERNCRCILPDCQRRKLEVKGYNHPAVVLNIQDNCPDGGELSALCCIVRLSILASLSGHGLNFGRFQQTRSPIQKKGRATLRSLKSRTGMEFHPTWLRTEQQFFTLNLIEPCTRNLTSSTLTSTPFRSPGSPTSARHSSTASPRKATEV